MPGTEPVTELDARFSFGGQQALFAQVACRGGRVQNLGHLRCVHVFAVQHQVERIRLRAGAPQTHLVQVLSLTIHPREGQLGFGPLESLIQHHAADTASLGCHDPGTQREG